MSEIVFLSNTNIQIAVGSSSGNNVKVSKLYSAPLPEGAVLNGVVMDPDVVIEAVKDVWRINKIPKTEVTLIINSPQLRGNRIDAPLMPDKKTTEFVTRETADAEYGRFQKPVTGWYLIGKNNKQKTQKVIYEIAEREFVNKYVEIFDKAGLKLKSIHNGVHLATEFFAKAATGKTVIYMILDGNSLVTIFFAEGQYYYDSTSRVFSQPGTPEFAREIYASISSIRQFISAQRLNETVRDVLFAGISQSSITKLANDILNIDSEIDISVANPPAGTVLSAGPDAFPYYVYPISGLRKIDEKLSILKAAKQTKESSSSLGVLKKFIIPAVGIFVIVGIVFSILSGVRASKKAELKELRDYINNPEVIAQVAEYDAMYENMSDIGSIQGGTDLLHEYIATYPMPDSSINRRILDAAAVHDVDVEFNTYSAATGVFRITASSAIVDDINMFIADLMSMDVFYNVDYTGYTLSQDGEFWQINVVCTLSERQEASGASVEVN